MEIIDLDDSTYLFVLTGAETWLLNAEPSANAKDFKRVRLGTSARLLPSLLGV